MQVIQRKEVLIQTFRPPYHREPGVRLRQAKHPVRTRRKRSLVEDPIRTAMQYGFQAFGAGAAYNYITRRWLPILDNDYVPPLPKTIYQWNSRVCRLLSHIDTNDVESTIVVIRPIAEELIFRVCLQEMLLKRLPLYVLGKMTSPKTSERIVNSKAAKVCRVVISASAFSLAHANKTRSLFFLTNAFIAGLALGALQEATANPLYPICAHMGNNLISGFWYQQKRESIRCDIV